MSLHLNFEGVPQRVGGEAQRKFILVRPQHTIVPKNRTKTLSVPCGQASDKKPVYQLLNREYENVAISVRNIVSAATK